MEYIIKIKDLNYSYNRVDGTDIDVIKNMSLEVKKGEFVVILGKNGSGKSTLSKLINGTMNKKSGTIEIDGLLLSEENTWDIRKKVGVVFQNPDNQIVGTVVEEDIAFGPENLGINPKDIEIRVEESLNKVGMLEYKKTPPHMLSGGQKQRIAIAGVLAINPEIMIFDEPTAMLDPIGRKQIMEIIYGLNKNENKTIVHITHHMNEALKADRIIVIEDGVIKLEGTPKEVFSRYEYIKNLGLDVPEVSRLVYELNKKGHNLDTSILSIEELVNSI